MACHSLSLSIRSETSWLSWITTASMCNNSNSPVPCEMFIDTTIVARQDQFSREDIISVNYHVCIPVWMHAVCMSREIMYSWRNGTDDRCKSGCVSASSLIGPPINMLRLPCVLLCSWVGDWCQVWQGTEPCHLCLHYVLWNFKPWKSCLAQSYWLCLSLLVCSN